MKRGGHRKHEQKPRISTKLSAVVLALLMVVMFMPTSVMAERSADTGGETLAAEMQSGPDQESGGSEAGSGNNYGEAEEGQQIDSEVAQSSEVKTETPAETTGTTGDDVGEPSNEGGSGESTPSNVTPVIPGDWSHSKSKTATNLDSKFNSTITLSVPSAEVPIATDVVFVLDKSTSVDVKDRIIRMLSDLQQSIDNSGATVKVGVVVFNKEAKQVLSLTELTKNNKGVIEDAVRSGLKSGTNLHAGILAGTKMLDEDTSVDNGRKYLILVSDGITYMYNSNPTAINSENGDRTNAFAGPDIWSVKYDSNEVTESWDSYLGRAKDQIVYAGL